MGAGNFSIIDPSIFDEVLASGDFSGGQFGGEEFAEQLGQGEFGGEEEIDWAKELGEMSKALKGMNQVKSSVGNSNLLRGMMQERMQTISRGGGQGAGAPPLDIEDSEDIGNMIANMLMQQMGL